MRVNAFDASSFVVVNDDERHSLTPTFADVAAGQRVVYGGTDRWTDIRPKGLRERLAPGRPADN